MVFISFTISLEINYTPDSHMKREKYIVEIRLLMSTQKYKVE